MPGYQRSNQFKSNMKSADAIINQLLLVLVIGLVLLIGWIRFLTSPEFAFSFL